MDNYSQLVERIATSSKLTAEEIERKVDEHIEKTIYEMPVEKREKLAVEVENLDIDVTRA